MGGLKGLKHLDYAVYGNLIVPFLLHDGAAMMAMYDDSDAGKCRIEVRPRKRK